MRFVAPARSAIDPAVFDRPPLSQWREFDGVLLGASWPTVGVLNALSESRTGLDSLRFVEQTPALLGDGVHYEKRIGEDGRVATRAGNWHDLFNALVWLRFPRLKRALNARQVAEIALAGPKSRTRAQCALTHFDEAGVIVPLRDASLLELWDAHDWHGLFWRERRAWNDGIAKPIVFGHALLEHALKPQQLLVGKAIAVLVGATEVDRDACESAVDAVATAIRRGELLRDPQELRPFPLSGIPGWLTENEAESFYFEAECFRPLRAGRRYPAASSLS